MSADRPVPKAIRRQLWYWRYVAKVHSQLGAEWLRVNEWVRAYIVLIRCRLRKIDWQTRPIKRIDGNGRRIGTKFLLDILARENALNRLTAWEESGTLPVTLPCPLGLRAMPQKDADNA